MPFKSLEERRAYGAAYRAANRDEINARVRANHAANPEKERARSRSRRAAQPEKFRARGRAKHASLRTKAIEALGGKCMGNNCYGWGGDMRVLQIDHVYGDGHMGNVSNKILREIAAGLFPGQFQSLCANCHFLKTLRNKEHLPRHQRPEAPNE